jgi:hypothetical protein
VRGFSVRQIKHDLINVTPTPTLWGIVAFDDRMFCSPKILAGMFVRRLITATNMAAGPTDPKMHPHATDLQTFLAAECARGNVADAQALLTGRIFDDRGNRMSPSHARKKTPSIDTTCPLPYSPEQRSVPDRCAECRQSILRR